MIGLIIFAVSVVAFLIAYASDKEFLHIVSLIGMAIGLILYAKFTATMIIVMFFAGILLMFIEDAHKTMEK